MRRFRSLLALVLCLMPVLATAHKPDQSYVFLVVGDETIHGRFEIAVSDLNAALDLDLPGDGTVTTDDIAPLSGRIRDLYSRNVRMYPDGREVPVSLGEPRPADYPGTQYVSVPFSLAPDPGNAEFLDIEYRLLLDPTSEHRGLLVVETNWRTSTFQQETNVRLVFSPSSVRQRLDLTEGSMLSGFGGMVGLGAHHIWIGIDHILFLVALLLPSVMRRGTGRWEAATGFRPAFVHMVKIVTIFTVAHSITLSLAALDVIRLSSRLVESAIALSIAIAAFDIVVPVFRERIGWVVFGFGLFHGLGFASVLGEIGIPAKYVTVSLVAFNVGVELGQIAVVALVFPVLFLIRDLRFYGRYAMPAGAVCLILISAYWFTERAFEVDLPAGAIANRVIELVI